MKWKQIKWELRYALQFFPFTLNTLIFSAAIALGFKYLYKPMPKNEDEPSALIPFILLMGKIVLIFVAAVILVSLISTIICWIYYYVRFRQTGNMLQLEFSNETRDGRKNRMMLHARLNGALRPILGFVKGRLYYDNNIMTDAFSLLSRKWRENSLIPIAITGKTPLQLPDIKEYDLKGGFIYFQDMLHLFSLAIPQPVTGHFYRPPVLLQHEPIDIFPRKTETLDVRIDELRRVEGEYLNYKDFESGDDVRRIVWKVYAKNRELVVRIPELMEPFASHLYFYASFYAGVKASWLDEGYLKEMLNYYKNCVWTVYDALSQKEYSMRYLPDIAIQVPGDAPPAEQAARVISNSDWHKDKSVSEYFNYKTGAVLVVSSLTDTIDLRNLLDKCDQGVVVYFVRLSKAMRHFAPLNWIGRLLFQPSSDRLVRLRTGWSISPIRYQLLKREKEIATVLQSANVTLGEL